jgi:hypothetical protein
MQHGYINGTDMLVQPLHRGGMGLEGKVREGGGEGMPPSNKKAGELRQGGGLQREGRGVCRAVGCNEKEEEHADTQLRDNTKQEARATADAGVKTADQD